MGDDGVARRAVLLSLSLLSSLSFVVALNCVDVVLELEIKISTLEQTKPIQHVPTPTPLLPPHLSSLLSLTCLLPLLLISNRKCLWQLCVTTGSADLINL